MDRSELESLSIDKLIDLSENDTCTFRYNPYIIYEVLGIKYKDEGKLDEMERMEKEHRVFLFPFKYSSNYDSQRVKETFSNDDIQYYKTRAKATKSPINKARYSDVIWEYDHDHRYAICSVDAHLDCATIFFDNKWDLELIDSLKRAFELSINLRNDTKILQCTDKVIEFITRLASSGRQGALYGLLELILSRYKLLKRLNYPDKSSDLVKIIKKTIEQLQMKEDSFLMQRKYMELLLIIWKDNQDKLNETKVKILNSYIAEAEYKKGSASASVASHFFHEAINYCKKLPNSPENIKTFKTETLKSLTVEFRKLSKTSEKEMHPITFGCEELFGKEFYNRMENNLERYEGKTPAELFKLISYDGYLLPSYSAAKIMADTYAEESVSYKILPIKLGRGDTYTKRISNVDEKKKLYLVKNFYTTYIMPCTIFWVNKVFDMLTDRNDEIEEDLIVCSSILEDIDEDFDVIEYEDEEEYINDLISFLSESGLISDSRLKIIEFGVSAYYNKEYVAANHILLFQIEGIIRDILEKLNLPSLAYKSENEIRAMMPIEMLSNVSTAEGIDEDLIEFMKIFLYDPEGKNFRNDTAHALLPVEAFNKENANLLLLILIKLAKYELRPL